MDKIKNLVKSKKFIVIAVIAVILVLGIMRVTNAAKTKYVISTAQTNNIIQVVAASGKLKSENQIDLKFQSSGLLSWVGVKEGDSVKKWQAIASLDKRQLQNDIKKRLLAYMNQRWSFEQTQDDYKTQKDNLTLTNAEKRILQEAQFNLDSSVIDVETYDLARQLATITSPIDGIVTNLVYTVPGENVAGFTPVATIVSPDKMVFEANIDEGDIAKIYMGQKAKITVDAYSGETFDGEVTKISFAATITSGGGTAFPVEISIPANDNFKFKIGMNGDAEMIAKEIDNVLTIPSTAIFQTNGQSFVWKVVNKTLTKQEITIGLDNGTSTEVLTGLSENDQILEEATSKIKGGEKI
jgi:HlyD family secretion protein